MNCIRVAGVFVSLLTGIRCALAALTFNPVDGGTVTRPNDNVISASGVTYLGSTNFYMVAEQDNYGPYEKGLHRVYMTLLDKSHDDTRSVCYYKHLFPRIEGDNRLSCIKLERTYDLESCAYDPGSGNIWAGNESGMAGFGEANTIREYDPVTGKIVSELDIHPIFSANLRSNLSWEALTISGDGLSLFCANEESLTCDGPRSSPTTPTVVRICRYTRPTTSDRFTLAGMYAYEVQKWATDETGLSEKQRCGGVSDLCALPDGTLLALERELSGDVFRVRICQVDYSKATDVQYLPALTDATYTKATRKVLWSYNSYFSIFNKNFYNYEGMCLAGRSMDGYPLLVLCADAGDGLSGPGTMTVVIDGFRFVEMDVDAPPVGTCTYAGKYFRFEKDKPLTVSVKGATGHTLKWKLPNHSPSSGYLDANGSFTFTPSADDRLSWELELPSGTPQITGTLSMADYTYGSSPTRASGLSAPAGSTLSYVYYADSACMTEMSEPTASTPAGTYYVRGEIKGTAAVSPMVAFKVNPRDMTATMSHSSVVYDGKAHSCPFSVTKPSQDQATFTWRSGNKLVANMPTLTACGTSVVQCVVSAPNYRDKYLWGTNIVTQATIKTVNLKVSSVPYDGKAHKPEVVSVTTTGGATLTNVNAGWTVTKYSRSSTSSAAATTDFTSPGKIFVTVTGKANLKATAVTATMEILQDPTVSYTVGPTDFVYSGSAQGPSVTAVNCTLGGTKTATSPGNYSMSVTPNSGFTWKDTSTTEARTIGWKITAASLRNDAHVKKRLSWNPPTVSSFYWADLNVVPDPALTNVVNASAPKALTLNTDYTMSYPADVSGIATYTNVVTGKGAYTGVITNIWKVVRPILVWDKAKAGGTWNDASAWTVSSAYLRTDYKPLASNRPAGFSYPDSTNAVAYLPAAASVSVDLGGRAFSIFQLRAQATNGWSATVANGTLNFSDHLTTTGVGDLRLRNLTLVPLSNTIRYLYQNTTADGGQIVLEQCTFKTNALKGAVCPSFFANAQHHFVVTNGLTSVEGSIVFGSPLRMRSRLTIHDARLSVAAFQPNVTRTISGVATTVNNCTDLAFVLGPSNRPQEETAPTRAMLQTSGKMRFVAGSTFAVDANGRAAGVYPLLAWKSLTTSAGFMTADEIVAAMKANLTGIDARTTGTVALAADGQSIALTIEDKDPVLIARPAVTQTFAYDGKTKTAARAGTGYTLTGATASECGTYTLVATLEPGYRWSDGTTAPFTATWSIQMSIASGKTANKFWTGGLVVPPLTVGGKALVAGTDYDWSIGGAKTNTLVMAYTVDFTGKGAYTGTLSLPWSISAITYTWKGVVGSSGAWADAGSWTCANTDTTYPGYTAIPTSFLGHHVTLRKGATVDLGGGERAAANLYLDGDTFRNGTLTYRYMSMTNTVGPEVTFERMTLKGYQTTTAPQDLIAPANGFVVFRGDNTLDASVRLRTERNPNGFVFKDGHFAGDLATALFWRSVNQATAIPVSYTITNASVKLTRIGTMWQQSAGRYDLSLAIRLGADADPRTRPALEAASTFELTRDATLAVDVGPYAKTPGVYPRVVLSGTGAMTVEGGEVDLAAWLKSMEPRITGTDPDCAYTLAPRTGNKGVDLVVVAKTDIMVAKPTVAAGFTYDGSTKTVATAATGYTVTGNTARNAGTYTFTAKLAPGYQWADGTTADYSVNWTIAAKSISGATTKKCFWTGDVVVPPLYDGTTLLTSGVDYDWNIGGAKTNANVSTKYTVAFTGKGNYSGTKTIANWEIAAVTYTWKGGASGDWATGPWTCNASDPYWTGDTYKATVSAFPNAMYGHLAVIGAGVTVDLGGKTYAANRTTLNDGARLRNGTLGSPVTYVAGKDAAAPTAYEIENMTFNYVRDAAKSTAYGTMQASGYATVDYLGTVNATPDNYPQFSGTDGGVSYNFRNGATTFGNFSFYRSAGQTGQRVTRTVEIENATVSVLQFLPQTNDIVNLRLILGANNKATSEPLLKATGSVRLTAGSTFAVNANGKGHGTYPLVRAGNNSWSPYGWNMTLDQVVASANANLTGVPSDCVGEVVKTADAKGLDLVIRLKSATVVFDGNGNTGGSMDPLTVTPGVTKLTANGFTRTGHTFLGWAQTPYGAVAYSDRYQVTDRDLGDWGARKTLYAKWWAEDEVVRLREKGDDRIGEILHTKDIQPSDGAPCYYVSELSGDDGNDGRTPETAWKTAAPLNAATAGGTLAAGSYVLFERGGLYRGTVNVASGVTYTAYGTGPKPLIYGSPENGADPSKWTLAAPNVWAYAIGDEDVGTLVFNEGAAHAVKVVIRTDMDTGKTYNLVTGKPFASYADLDTDLHFWHDYADDGKGVYRGTGKVYLYSKENPGSRFGSIEFNVRRRGFYVATMHDVTIDNFTVKYLGWHGVGANSCTNLVVSNCEFGWIGGSIQSDGVYGRDYPTRFGNGVEVYGACENYVVTNCYVYQAYDAGLTPQFSIKERDGMRCFDEKNVRFADNVIEKCNYSVEYFLGTKEVPANPTRIENFVIEDNLMFDAGFGFCEQRPDRGVAAHIKGAYAQSRNRATGFVIRNNVFCNAQDALVQIGSSLKNADGSSSLPALTNNVFVGRYGDDLGHISETSSAPVLYDEFAEDFVNQFGRDNRCIQLAAKPVDISSGTTQNCLWTGDVIAPPLKVGKRFLRPNVDYAWTYAGLSASETTTGTYRVTFTPLEPNTGSLSADWAVARVTYSWPDANDGAWETALWKGTVYDHWHTNFAAYASDVSLFPNGAFGHEAVVKKGVTIDLGSTPKSVYRLQLQGDTVQNGSLAFRAMVLAGVSTFRNVSFSANRVVAGNYSEFNPSAGATVVFAGNNTFGPYVRLRTSTAGNQSFVFKDGDAVIADGYTFWKSTDLATRLDVNFAITNATVELGAISTMNGANGIYDVHFFFKPGEVDARTKPLLKAKGMTLASGATLTVDIGDFATKPGVYKLIELTKYALAYGGADCQAFCTANANNIIGKNASYGYALVPASGDMGVNLVIREKSAVGPTIAAGLVYKATSQNGYTSAGTHVALSGTPSATDAGSYTLTATPEEDYAWSDGTYGAKNYTWTIAPRSVADGKTSNCVWTGVTIHPPLVCNGVLLTAGTDYTYTVGGASVELKDVGAYNNLVFTGKGNYTGTFTAATWSIARVTYAWDVSASGDWDSASWRCSAYDPYFGSYGKDYLEKVSRFPNAAVAHYARLEKGVTVDLGPTPRVTSTLFVAGDTIRNGTLAIAATLQMTCAVKRVTFRNVTLRASEPATSWTELNPRAGGTVAFEGDNTLDAHVRLRSSTYDDQTFSFRDGETISAESFTLYRSSNTNVHQTVRLAVTNATVSLGSLSNMNGANGLYDLKMAFGLGSVDTRTKPVLKVRSGALVLTSGASLSVDVGDYATVPGTYKLIEIAANELTFGGKDCQAFCDAMAANVTGASPDFRYLFLPAARNRGINLVVYAAGKAEMNGLRYATLAEAGAAARPGDTLRLLSAPTAEDPLVLRPGVTVDLNGTVPKLAANTYVTPGDWFDVSVEAGLVTIALNEKARPTVGDGTDAAFVVGDDAVSVTVGNVKPNLYYGLAFATTLEALAAAMPTTWSQADASGNLAPLTLEKPAFAAAAFCRVVAVDCLLGCGMKTPETSSLFEKYVDPVSNVTSYMLRTGLVSESHQSLYFNVKSMTDDGRFLVFVCRPNEYTGDGSGTFKEKSQISKCYRGQAVIDFLKDEVIRLESDLDGTCTRLDTERNTLYYVREGNTRDEDAICRRDLMVDPLKDIVLCRIPYALHRNRSVRHYCSHLTFTAARDKVFLDSDFVKDGTTGTDPETDREFEQGFVDLKTGAYIPWGRTDFWCDHGQLNPKDDTLALCAWEACDQGAGKAYQEATGWYPRMWLLRPDGSKELVPARDKNRASHEIWDDDGKGLSWCGAGVWHHDLATGRQELCCPTGTHATLSPDKKFVVYDAGEVTTQWRGSPWRVGFWNRETERGVDVYSMRPALGGSTSIAQESKLHPDPHPQFVCNGRYIISTFNNLDGHMDLLVTPVAQLVERTRY